MPTGGIKITQTYAFSDLYSNIFYFEIVSLFLNFDTNNIFYDID
jgi:hypothetical protein